MQKEVITNIGVAICLLFSLSAIAARGQSVDDGVIDIPAIKLPHSHFLSQESQKIINQYHQSLNRLSKKVAKNCLTFDKTEKETLIRSKQCIKNLFYQSDFYLSMEDRYSVHKTEEIMGGVLTEIFVPAEGIKLESQHKVLINLHGGGFVGGSQTNSRLESIPIAAIGKIKVVSIDYRLAPEYQFPAASEDVEKVYRELLKDYQPENIGLFGCSAGSMLTAQSIGRLVQEGLPLPAAIGLFCMGAGTAYDYLGDSGLMAIGPARAGFTVEKNRVITPYFIGVEPTNPLAFPGISDEQLSQFPPTLLLTATRDYAMSSVITTHQRLRQLGVDADLLVWEGLEHAFHYNSELPESREAYKLIVEFFESRLGAKEKSQNK